MMARGGISPSGRRLIMDLCARSISIPLGKSSSRSCGMLSRRKESGSRPSHPSGKPTNRVGLADLLSTLGLRDLHGGKLTLSRVLEINSNTVTDKPAESLEHLPWIFLKKLMMSNLNARNVKCVSQNFDEGSSPLDDFHADSINPLDVITAVLHCADPFLQQEIVSKMAMCQFAVPLLMPNIDSRQSTLMLWAFRDIVKKYRHLSLADAKTFVEGRIVQIDMPVISFVRLGQCSLPKSLTLNKLLSNPHQHNETFVHYDMEGGDVPRKIDDGLVEISWYLPCGNNNIDMFTQPVAIANLRGDARTLEAQMSFLLQISTAVFIFCDDLESDLSILTSREIKAKLFLVINSQSETFNKETLSATCRKHNFAVNNVIVKKKQSDADFVRVLRSNVKEAIEKNPMKTTIEDMAAVASQVGILVDEHDDECAKGKFIAEEITRDITDVVRFKENQLPLHGKTWKEISQLEKERCRMKKAGKDIEQYRCSLQKKEKELRKIQKQTSVSDAMKKFITGISQSRTERLYFLKWLKIQLDNCSRQNLSSLREKYKECCQSTPGEKEKIAHLDEQISNCSLGPEHFFRELGQIYEAASSPPLNDPARQQYQDLPKLCAQMLLDGFPIELVDGDASNIPLKWISEVLTQLHVKVENNSRILVLTVLGVQSTGKSTLLNTMFGVQFAVSSGRCTRGAFMLLTKVSEEYKPQLKCDFIMIIDTEGLKSPELAALDTSYEHDNELATLVIGLSDVTIINIAMENSTEMKDILQIVVHAFLRMKEVGKKPRCLFVHQNVSDMAAHDSNLRDRKKLVEQLDEMTRAAARMEKKEAHTKFTDVMEYDPDRNTRYIPGLWHGTPPMAPVNAGYSEAVYALKKSLISSFQMCNFQGNDAKKFLGWTTNLWDAVKFENFIFSFRNSLVADAYANLCIEYNKWEWEFQKKMNSWMVSKETYISNFGVIDNHVQKNHLRGELRNLLKEASTKVSQEEEKILQQLEKYFEQKDSHVGLVEKYRADFKASAQSLRRETEASIKYSLQRAVEIKEGMEKVNTIKRTQAETIERKVQELLKACQKKNAALSDSDIEREFENMWKTTVEELSVSLPKQNVVQETLHELRVHFETKTGAVKKAINKEDFEKSGQTGFAVNSRWWENVKAMFVGILRHRDLNHAIRTIQELCDKIISDCEVIVSDIVKAKNDFNKTYIKEILNKIDEGIKEGQKKFNINEQCESSLKFHICYKAAVEFQKMHDKFIADNNPKNCLEQSKSKFLEEFKDLYHERDQCQKKAAEFTETCLKPAVRCYVIKNLGPDIADDMMSGDAGQDYSTRTNFQYALLKQLLEKKISKNIENIHEGINNLWKSGFFGTLLGNSQMINWQQ
ncbi:hypothetical protein GJAV_G00202810 [Gymnothorax javanicus]|nr:hypothetical protein GJAV_G00202810 [Gymnothorax javanicus]